MMVGLETAGGGRLCVWGWVSPGIFLPRQRQHGESFPETLPSPSWQGEFSKGWRERRECSFPL